LKTISSPPSSAPADSVRLNYNPRYYSGINSPTYRNTIPQPAIAPSPGYPFAGTVHSGPNHFLHGKFVQTMYQTFYC